MNLGNNDYSILNSSQAHSTAAALPCCNRKAIFSGVSSHQNYNIAYMRRDLCQSSYLKRQQSTWYTAHTMYGYCRSVSRQERERVSRELVERYPNLTSSNPSSPYVSSACLPWHVLSCILSTHCIPRCIYRIKWLKKYGQNSKRWTGRG